MGKGPEQTFLQRGHTDGQQTYEKLLNVTNHQRNANLNHNEIASHTYQEWLSSVNQQTTSDGKDVEKGEPFCTVGGNADWWRAIWEYLKKIKNGSAF